MKTKLHFAIVLSKVIISNCLIAINTSNAQNGEIVINNKHLVSNIALEEVKSLQKELLNATSEKAQELEGKIDRRRGNDDQVKAKKDNDISKSKPTTEITKKERKSEDFKIIVSTQVTPGEIGKKYKVGSPDDVKYGFEKEIDSLQDQKVAKQIRDKLSSALQTNKKTVGHKTELLENRERKKLELMQAASKVHLNNKIKKDIEQSKIKGLDWEPSIDPNVGAEENDENKEVYEIDPILNILREGTHTRRKKDQKKEQPEEDRDMHILTDSNAVISSEHTISESSTVERNDFKEQFKEMWLGKKYEAIHSTIPSGDTVNMQDARPWGTKCGDPGQHDMPWGSCLLAIECEAEFRIFKGDIYCGRTSFVCCALEVTTYDTYQGFDVSFDSKGLSTDSEELKANSKAKKSNGAAAKKRRKSRNKRKDQIRKTIRRIIKEISHILNRTYRDASKQKRRKTKHIRKFVEFMKTEYKNNRQAAKELHGESLITIDIALMQRLRSIKAMNKNFINNKTFAEIIANGQMTKVQASMLIEAYPELEEFISADNGNKNANNTRRFGGLAKQIGDKKKSEYLEYDIEYGFLYY